MSQSTVNVERIGVSEVGPSHPSDRRQLPVYCPECGVQVEVVGGLCGNRLVDAILLQAERLGAELRCHRCRTGFVFQKLE